MIPPLQRASDVSIKVISLDTSIGNGDYANGPITFPVSYIGSNNIESGPIGCRVQLVGVDYNNDERALCTGTRG